MPTQGKKSLAVTPTDRPAKPKRKKKKESGRNSRSSSSKTPASGADSSSEGTRHKSIAKSRSEKDNVKKPADDLSSTSRSSSTQNTSSSGWRVGSSDGRSTSSSGENFGATSCTNSASSEESHVRKRVDDLKQSSSTSLTRINESLRWDYTNCDDPEEEEERLRIYKLHRRKRYMDFLHKTTGGEPPSSFYA